MFLERIQGPNDIKKIEPGDYPALAKEIREFLIEKISVTGGHLASNLGTVELTMALHLALDLPQDKIVWDVGHQSYTHKLLTGRREGFDSLRCYQGMSGFPKGRESDCDSFDTGHSSTSISAALGIAKARDLQGENSTVVAVIGDGSMTGGMAYEALNNAAEAKTNFIIILNDNEMSISRNVGGISNYLNRVRTGKKYLNLKEDVYNALKKTKRGDHSIEKIRKLKSWIKSLVVPGMYFEEMGITYLGPVDGHDVKAMVNVIREAQHVKSAVLIHVVTQKGRGYTPALHNPSRFHGTDPFDIHTGLPVGPAKEPSYTDIFSTVMFKMGERDPKVVAITAAMPDGTGLARFRNKYPDRFFDVGIAEEHAVTFAAGLAKGGMKPVVAIYSSFLQRAYDQILHDVCLQQLPVVFAVDRAGLVGKDGETHQGIFDISYLNTIPGMTVMAPKNKWELSDMMKFAVNYGKPVAIRYPRGAAYTGLKDFREPIEPGRSEWIYREKDILLLCVGSMVETGEKVRERLISMGHSCSLVNVRFVKPVDTACIEEAADSHKLTVTLEENVITGGFGEQVLRYVQEKKLHTRVLTMAFPDAYVEHGDVNRLKKENGMDEDGILARILEEIKA